MTHEEFLKKLYDLKDQEQSAREDYLNCLEEQKKAKKIWAILKSKIQEHRSNYDKQKLADKL